jgi:hypothetical protein
MSFLSTWNSDELQNVMRTAEITRKHTYFEMQMPRILNGLGGGTDCRSVFDLEEQRDGKMRQLKSGPGFVAWLRCCECTSRIGGGGADPTTRPGQTRRICRAEAASTAASAAPVAGRTLDQWAFVTSGSERHRVDRYSLSNAESYSELECVSRKIELQSNMKAPCPGHLLQLRPTSAYGLKLRWISKSGAAGSANSLRCKGTGAGLTRAGTCLDLYRLARIFEPSSRHVRKF